MVTVVLLLLVPESATTLPIDSVVEAEALPRILKAPPPKVRVAPWASAGTAPPPRREFTLVPLLSSVSMPPSFTVLFRNAVVPTPLYRTTPWLTVRVPNELLVLLAMVKVPVPTLLRSRVLVMASLYRANLPVKAAGEVLSQPKVSVAEVVLELSTLPEPCRLPNTPLRPFMLRLAVEDARFREDCGEPAPAAPNCKLPAFTVVSPV